MSAALRSLRAVSTRASKTHEMFPDDVRELSHLYAPESENQSIGAMMMLDGGAVETGLALLHETMFCGARNRAVFRAIRRLRDDARIHDDIAVYIEPVSVGAQMKRDGTFEDWTGGYLASLVFDCPCAAIIRQSAEAVRRCAQLRFQREAARVLARRIAGCDADAALLGRQMMQALAAIEKSGWCDLEAIFAK